LEQLRQVAGGVGEQDLAPAGTGDYVASEGQTGLAEPRDLGVQVVDDEVDAVAAGGGGVVGGGAGAGAGGSGKQEPERAAYHVGEGGRGAAVQGEAKVRDVEVDGRLHVVDDVADTGVVVGSGHGGPP
jgi:hypothetical protein